jgi:putative endonuclease
VAVVGSANRPQPPTRSSQARGDPRHELGRRGEQLACEHLERRGFRVLERNFRTRLGEIDVIAYDGRTLVFAEVKTARAGSRHAAAPPLPEPLAWLDRRQRAGLRRVAAAWLADASRARPSAHEIRMDAVGIVLDPRGALLRLEHLEAAF